MVSKFWVKNSLSFSLFTNKLPLDDTVNKFFPSELIEDTPLIFELLSVFIFVHVLPESFEKNAYPSIQAANTFVPSELHDKLPQEFSPIDVVFLTQVAP